jgi:hypothetical protein
MILGNDDFFRSYGSTVCRPPVGLCKFSSFANKSVRVGGTGKDFMIGKIYLTNLKSCRYRHSRTENPPAERVGNAQISWGENPQTSSRGRFTRATALVASTHPNPPTVFSLPNMGTQGGRLIFTMNDSRKRRLFPVLRLDSLPPTGWFV